VERTAVDVRNAVASEGTAWRTPEVRQAPAARREVEIERFVADVRAAGDDRLKLDAVIGSAWPTWSSVAEFVRLAPGRVTRTLVYRDEAVEILVLAWARGARSPIHDHGGQASWMLMSRGELDLTDYRLMAGGTRPGVALIEPAGPTRRLTEGEWESRLSGAEVHAVRTCDDAPFAVTIQLYSRPIDRYLVYDPRRVRCEERRLTYDYVGPRRRGEMVPAALGGNDERPGPATWWRQLERWVRRARQVGEDLLVPADVSKDGAQVRIESLGHKYGSVQALRDLSLNVRSGEFLCLLGPSGCGKSTLLHALAGHVRPTCGLLAIDGKPVHGPGPDRLVMFQEPGLFPWMTVEQNITFVLAARGLSRAERRRRAREYLRLVQLDGFENTLPHQLSGGMKMRASLARALAVDSPVLLMDEPFGSLDAQTRARMHELVQRLWMDRQKTVVFVTHDVHEALLLGTRVVVMAARPGRVLCDLEVRLPHPRDVDDASLAALAARVRAVLRDAEAGGGRKWDGDDASAARA
jgi:NitT/TauT family transport system ATP-binding protein